MVGKFMKMRETQGRYQLDPLRLQVMAQQHLLYLIQLQLSTFIQYCSLIHYFEIYGKKFPDLIIQSFFELHVKKFLVFIFQSLFSIHFLISPIL